MKVLHVTISFGQGGRREAISTLARGLRGLGIESHLCCLDDLDTDAGGLTAFGSAVSLNRQCLFDLAALRRLRAHCKALDIDMLHAHDAASEAMCALAMPDTRTPLLMSFHRTRNFESARMRDRIRNAFVGLRVGAVVTASLDRLRHYRETNYVPARKVRCIPLGINLARFRPDEALRDGLRTRLGLAGNELLVGAVGHFAPVKGIDNVLLAFQEFLRRRPDIPARLVVLGRGDPEDEARVRALVDPMFSDRIVFAGFQNRPEEWFPGFDAMLHGARAEAFGLVLAEAQACGVPVAAARVGAIPEVIADGETGRLAEPDSPTSLAIALEEILCDPVRRAAMAAAAIERANRAFTVERYAEQYRALYTQLVRQ